MEIILDFVYLLFIIVILEMFGIFVIDWNWFCEWIKVFMNVFVNFSEGVVVIIIFEKFI